MTMTPAARRYKRAGVQLRIARAKLLLQVADGRGVDRLADLLKFARQIGDCVSADSLSAFRAAQEELLLAAQAELARLPAPDALPDDPDPPPLRAA